MLPTVPTVPTVPTRESGLRLRNNETQRQRVACRVGVLRDTARGAMAHG
ncbi:hypothetical protein FHR49_000887 [Xanthomonas campestris]